MRQHVLSSSKPQVQYPKRKTTLAHLNPPTDQAAKQRTPPQIRTQHRKHALRTTTRPSSQQPDPFLKWAGGKRWLPDRCPNLFEVNFRTYVEPFLGSGAIFFRLTPSRAILSDNNLELIQTYQAIRDDWQLVHKHLKRHQALHSREHYYTIRSQHPSGLAARAARFIYLNRTCWNGLYRVNLKGAFNVPIGTKTNVLLPTDQWATVSKLLNNAALIASDFETIIEMAEKEDFLFVDPPYTVKHNFNGFIKYNQKLFSWDDQVRLRDTVTRAVRRGVRAIICNAAHESVQDLYKRVGEQMTLPRGSVISGRREGRGQFEELIIKCY